jgi:hypothetical protein
MRATARDASAEAAEQRVRTAELKREVVAQRQRLRRSYARLHR